MLVRERMTPNPICVQVDASIAELTNLMKQNKLKKVPVVKGDQLVGIVTDKDVDRVSPSGATTLSVFEIGALLSKATVKDAMSKDVITCTPETCIEDAAILMRDNHINALVVLNGDKIAGIITESDMLDSFIAMLGGRTEGNRYVVSADNIPGVLNQMGGVTHELGINMTHFVFTQCTSDGKAELVFRTTKDGKIEEVSKKFESLGYTVVDASVR